MFEFGFVLIAIVSLLFGIYMGFKMGFNYGLAIGRAKEFVHFTVAIEKSFPDKLELNAVLDRVSKEYNILNKPKGKE